ncbi:schlafen family member 11 isoform X2 [Psammomys obesus]|uniref:schlafen family member 11 isoform X2 n=1 Tax=Psammomys obesus TaxID=48139 RepID=UPI00245370AF|nr:schlafen family member 11 isoform X2 [Psammomys obesus]
METNPSLVVVRSHPDLVIYVGEVTLGEEHRNKMDKTKRMKEKEKITQAACALLNSGGGVIEMQIANKTEHPVEMGEDLEHSLRDLIPSSNCQTFFETDQRGNQFYIFVKSWCCGPEDGSPKPQICSLSSSLYTRNLTSKIAMDSRSAFDFLYKKRKGKCSLSDNGPPPLKIPRALSTNSLNSGPAFTIFQSEKLEYGQKLPFTETEYIEFKQFFTKHAPKYMKNIIPEYISAFANTDGGYLFIGVDNESKSVLGCPKDSVDCDCLKTVANEAISKLPVFHFSSSKEKVSYETRVIDVFKEGDLYGYLCVIRVEPCCCAVFSKAPISFMVDKEKGVYSLNTDEWVRMMMDVGPEAAPNQQASLNDLCTDFECQLNLSNSPPRCRPVYSKKGLEHKVDLQRHLFPAQQYEILSKSLRKTRKLFVHGLPGTGKTIMAMKIMEKIRNTFHCETDNILYICENQLLRDLIAGKNLCQAVTRKTFMRPHFNATMVQHIIVDEAQNFRTEDGNWYEKVEKITQSTEDCRILWIFLDYFQTSHLQMSGLPHFSRQFPKEELTKVVRNADNIAAFLKQKLQEIRNVRPKIIPPESLEMLHDFNWCQGVSGSCETRNLSWHHAVSYVADKCDFFLRNGYSPQDIAVLFSTDSARESYENMFLEKMRRINDAFIYPPPNMFDSIRRFSGLERSIVFGIDPSTVEWPISRNLLLCLASRARKHLYILFCA